MRFLRTANPCTMWTAIKYVLFLIAAILGNPIYQLISFILTSLAGWSTSSGFMGKTSQISPVGYVVFLILIFLLRYMIYSKRFTGSFFDTEIKGEHSFLYVFSKAHVYQLIGLLTFPLWTERIEGSYFSLILMASLALGIVVSIITIIRLRMARKKWKRVHEVLT